jgi:hypothetical protein
MEVNRTDNFPSVRIPGFTVPFWQKGVWSIWHLIKMVFGQHLIWLSMDMAAN